MIFICTCLIIVSGSVFNDDYDFQDFFNNFDASKWRKDFGNRHCGNQSPVGCVWTKRENLEYESDVLTPGGLRISLRNDCEEDYCCVSETQCTSYTSGQLTSRNLYGYGTYSFTMKIEKKLENYRIKSTTFKSVYCLQSPSSDMFPTTLRKAPTIGYCEHENADLSRFSSNRDLCHSSMGSASKKHICGRYTWLIETFSPSWLHFQAIGKSIDYVNTAIYIDDDLVVDGGRDLIQKFQLRIKKAGIFELEIFGFEDCCAGGYKDGYKGWDIHRSEYLGHKAGAIEIPPPKIERNGQNSEGSSGAASSFNSDDSGMLVSFFAHDWRAEQRFLRLQDSTLEPSEFTTTEAVDETTEEPTYDLEQSEITDELDSINLSEDPTPCRRERGCSSAPARLFERLVDCRTPCNVVATSDAPATSNEDARPDRSRRPSYTGSVNSAVSSASTDIMLHYMIPMLSTLHQLVEITMEVLEDEDNTVEDVALNIRKIRHTMDVIQAEFMAGRETLYTQWDDMTDTSLIFMIRDVQDLIKATLDKTRTSTGYIDRYIPDEAADLIVVYQTLLKLESMLLVYKREIGVTASGSSAGLDSDYDLPPLEEDTDEPDSRQSPLRQEYNVTYPRLPPLEEESGLDVGMLTDFGNNLQNRINHPSRQDDTTIEHLTKSTSNIGYGAQAPSIDYEALFCFNLQENPKDSEINIFQRLGICLSSMNSEKAILFSSFGQHTYKQIVDLPFDAAKRIGRYEIQWLPDRITWIANDQKIGTINKRILPVPYGNMRIKLFAAPQNPREGSPDVHIEQVMQVLSLSHRKYAIKDEMRLEEESRHNTYLWLFAMGFAAFLVVLYSFYAFCFGNKIKEQASTGYIMLAEREQMI